MIEGKPIETAYEILMTELKITSDEAREVARTVFYSGAIAYWESQKWVGVDEDADLEVEEFVAELEALGGKGRLKS